MLEEFLNFIRFKVCLLAAAVGGTGYLMFTPVSIELLFVVVFCFSLGVIIYGYNQITDREEDLVNNGKINSFVESEKGVVALMAFAVGGFMCTLPFGSVISSLYVFTAVWGVAYSFFRLKKYLLVKNIYTGFSFGILFIMGAMTGSIFSISIFLYYLLLSTMFFSISVIADMRDIEGDGLAGVKTLPGHFGIVTARRIVYALLFLPGVLIFSLGLTMFYTLIPFSACCYWLLKKNRVILAHKYQLVSFICLPLVILIQSL